MTDSLDLRGTAESESPDAYVRGLIARTGSSFLWGMRLLPPARRRAMYGIYAFCREVDDIADGPGDETWKRAQLELWRREVEFLFEGVPSHPIMQTLQDAAGRFNLPKAEFLAVIDGMESDIRAPLRAPSQAEFTLYCRRVAGAVGLLSVHAFGAQDAIARELAVVEGEALQITNILRDLHEDAARGRLYVPKELLAVAGIAATGEPRTVLTHPAFPGVHQAFCAMARSRFTQARTLIGQSRGSSLRPARLMLEIYSRLLDRLEAAGWPDESRKVKVPRSEKLWLVLRYGLL